VQSKRVVVVVGAVECTDTQCRGYGINCLSCLYAKVKEACNDLETDISNNDPEVIDLIDELGEALVEAHSPVVDGRMAWSVTSLPGYAVKEGEDNGGE